MAMCKQLLSAMILASVGTFVLSNLGCEAQLLPGVPGAPGALGVPGAPLANPPIPELQHAVVPTDVTGPGGSLGYAKGIWQHILGPDQNPVPFGPGYIIARDPRYSFCGIWRPLNAEQVAVSNGVLTRAAVIIPGTDFGSSQIMSSAGAQVAACGPNAISLNCGAIMLKVGDTPVTVDVPLCNGRATVRLRRGAVAVVSLLSGHLMVANLHDRHRDSIVLNMADCGFGNRGYSPVRIGNLVEVYPSTTTADNELVAYGVTDRVAISNGYTVETMRFSYPLLMKRCNVSRFLSEHDLLTVMKSAAAVAWDDAIYPWHGP